MQCGVIIKQINLFITLKWEIEKVIYEEKSALIQNRLMSRENVLLVTWQNFHNCWNTKWDFCSHSVSLFYYSDFSPHIIANNSIEYRCDYFGILMRWMRHLNLLTLHWQSGMFFKSIISRFTFKVLHSIILS